VAKIKTGSMWKPEPVRKRTSQASRKSSVKLSSMNKSKKRSFKPSRGQG
jgi:hypothetical protein